MRTRLIWVTGSSGTFIVKFSKTDVHVKGREAHYVRFEQVSKYHFYVEKNMVLYACHKHL